jgi:hypothetical protein
MDPNITLLKLHRAMRMMRDGIDGNGDLITAAELAEMYFTALDEWLSNGGFLPDAWLDTANLKRGER